MGGCCRDKARAFFEQKNKERALTPIKPLPSSSVMIDSSEIDESQLSPGAKMFKKYLDSKS